MAKYIDEIELAGKRAFIRADLNVPFDKAGEIADDNRIRASLPTIQYALERGAKVVLASHLGRPDGKRDAKYSLKPVAKRLEELLRSRVIIADDCIGPEVEKLAHALKPGEILLLENVRFHAAEEENDEAFSKSLAALADVYINDAFATAHRKHASTFGMVKFFSVKAGGFTMKEELSYFEKAFHNPERPFLAIFGGAKVSTKMEAIRNVGQRADILCIGGAMANTFFVADGHQVGKSLYEPEEVKNAKEIKEMLTARGCELLLPTDVVVAAELKSGVPTRQVPINAIGAADLALDIGAESVQRFQNAISRAKTIIWNGPMGAFETEDFASGTFAIVDALADSNATTVIGGGDTDLALHQRHAFEKMSYVSTAGGAFLKLLEGKTLPAVKALDG